MIIQCGACGSLKNIPHKGTSEEIEQGVHNAIENGWRYIKSYDGWACPNCTKDNPDKLYEMYCGKLKPSNKADSYRKLIQDVAWLIQSLR